MSIQTKWLNQTTIYQSYSGLWSLDDFINASQDVFWAVDAVDHRVDVFLDFSDNEVSFMDVYGNLSIQEYHQLESLRHPNIRLTFIKTNDPFLTLHVRAAARVAPRMVKNLYFVDSFDDAEKLISHHNKFAPVE